MKKYGGDFELHLLDKNGNPIAAEPILGIDKNAYISSDCTAAEIRPIEADTIHDFLKNTRELLKQLYFEQSKNITLCPALAIGMPRAKELDFINFEELYTKTIEEFNSYYDSLLKKVFVDENTRSQGAHLWLDVGNYDMKEIVKLLDMYIALPLTMLFYSPLENKRRIKYGMAGNYRTKNNLLEYRVLSSSILRHPIILTEILYGVDTILQNKYEAKRILDLITREYNIAEIINTGNCEKAINAYKNIMRLTIRESCQPVRKQLLRFEAMINYCKFLNVPQINSSDIAEAWCF